MIERLRSLGLDLWTYGSATVRFSADSLQVIGWENAARTLHVAVRPGPNATASDTFVAGSHADDVVRLMGTPESVREDRAHGTMAWRYGASAVTIATLIGESLGSRTPETIFASDPPRLLPRR